MNIDYNAVIEILKSFLNNEKIEILGISVGEERQVKDAIRNLLTAYEKEKEKTEKQDKIIQAMANDIYIEIVKSDGSHFATVEEVVEYFEQQVSKT